MNKFYKNKRFIKWLYDIDSYIASGGDSFYLNAPVDKSNEPASCILWQIATSTTGTDFTISLTVMEEPVNEVNKTKVYKMRFGLYEIEGSSINNVCENAEREAHTIVDSYCKSKNIYPVVDGVNTYSLIVAIVAKALTTFSAAFTELGESE